MGRALTVVQLLPALESGGVERSTIEIAEALVRDGHRAIVVSAAGRLLPALRATGAEHVEWDIGRKSPWTLRHVPALRRLFADVRADVVHAARACRPGSAGSLCAAWPERAGRISSLPCTASTRLRATAPS